MFVVVDFDFGVLLGLCLRFDDFIVVLGVWRPVTGSLFLNAPVGRRGCCCFIGFSRIALACLSSC